MRPSFRPIGNSAFLLVMAMTVLGVGGGTAFLITRLQERAVAEYLDLAAVHARAFEDQLERNLATVGSITELLAAASLRMQEARVDELFGQTLRYAPFLRSLSMVDGAGLITMSSNPANTGRQVRGELFLPVDSSEDGLRIGPPWAGDDIYNGRPSSEQQPLTAEAASFIPVLHQVVRDGRLVTLLASLDPDFLSHYFHQRLAPELGYVEILRPDRMVLLSTDDWGRPGSLAQVLAQAEVAKARESTEEGKGGGPWPEKKRSHGQFEEERPDGETLLTAFRVSRRYPLQVVVRLRRSEALADWQSESRRLLLAVGPALLVLVVLSTLLYRYQQRLLLARAEARQREHERLAATVFTNVAEAVVVTGADSRIITVNPAFTRITGYPPDEVVGRSARLLVDRSQPARFRRELRQALAGEGHWVGEVRQRRKSGELFVAWLSANVVRDERGGISHLVAVFSDFTEHRAEADRIEYLAHHDLLTGLPNRTLFLDRLRQAVSTAARHHHQLALIFIDLDKFKPVNDRLGHRVGDLLLQKVAGRLLAGVRAEDTVVRLGGDEFVVLLPVLDGRDDALVTSAKLRQSLLAPFHLDGHRVSISSSNGVAIYPEDGLDENELLEYADAMMYRAKAAATGGPAGAGRSGA